MTRRKTKYEHEGHYVVEVEVDLIEDETDWSPYLSVDDACKLDDARAPLRRRDYAAAARLGLVYELRAVLQQ